MHVQNALCTAETELLKAAAAAKQHAELGKTLEMGETAIEEAKGRQLERHLMAESKVMANARRKEKEESK